MCVYSICVHVYFSTAWISIASKNLLHVLHSRQLLVGDYMHSYLSSNRHFNTISLSVLWFAELARGYVVVQVWFCFNFCFALSYAYCQVLHACNKSETLKKGSEKWTLNQKQNSSTTIHVHICKIIIQSQLYMYSCFFRNHCLFYLFRVSVPRSFGSSIHNDSSLTDVLVLIHLIQWVCHHTV